MTLQALFAFVLNCHAARNEILRCENKSNFHFAEKWMDHGHLEMKGEEHNIMKVSNWLITKENTSMNLHSLLLCKVSVYFHLNLLKYIVKL